MFKNWDLTHKNQISFFPKKSGDLSTLGVGVPWVAAPSRHTSLGLSA